MRHSDEAMAREQKPQMESLSPPYRDHPWTQTSLRTHKATVEGGASVGMELGKIYLSGCCTHHPNNANQHTTRTHIYMSGRSRVTSLTSPEQQTEGKGTHGLIGGQTGANHRLLRGEERRNEVVAKRIISSLQGYTLFLFILLVIT